MPRPRLRPLNRSLNQLIVHKQKVAQIGQNLGGGVMAYKQGGGANQPVFDMPLSSSLTNGVGTLSSFTRGDADATVEDFEGLVKTVTADEARFVGARRAENLSAPPYSWLCSPAAHGHFDFDPLTGIITTTGLGVSAGLSTQAPFSKPVIVAGRLYRSSIEIRYVSDATKPLNVRLTHPNYGTTDISHLVTTEWKRFSSDVTNSVAPSFLAHGVVCSVEVGDQIQFRFPMFEDVTGQENQNPSDFVPKELGTGLEHITDHSFDDATEWTIHADWSISGGNLLIPDNTTFPSTATPNTEIAAEIGETYLVLARFSDNTDPGSRIAFKYGGVTAFTGGVIAVAPYIAGALVQATTTDGFEIECTGSFPVADTYIEWVSVQKIVPTGSNADGVEYYETINLNTVTDNIMSQSAAPIGADVQQIASPEDFDGWVGSVGNTDFTAVAMSLVGGKIEVDAAGGVIAGVDSVFTAEIGKYYRVQYETNLVIAPSFGFAFGGVSLPYSIGNAQSFDIIVKATDTTSFAYLTARAAAAGSTFDSIYITPLNRIPDDMLKGVLIEEQSVNLLQESEDITTWWTPFNFAPHASETRVSPITGKALLKVDEQATASAQHQLPSPAGAVPLASTVTVSCYVSADERDQIRFGVYNVTDGNIAAWFDLTTETWTNVGADDYGEEKFTLDGQVWFRLWVTATPTVANSYIIYELMKAGAISYVGIAGEGMYVDGLQCEYGGYASSYIPSTGGTTQRDLETLKYELPAAYQASDLAGYSMAATMFARFKTAVVTNYLLDMSDNPAGAIDNRVALVSASVVNTSIIAVEHKTSVTSIIGVNPLTDYAFNRLGAMYDGDAGNVYSYMNGGLENNVLQANDLDLTAATAEFIIGDQSILGSATSTTVKDVKLYDKALSNDEMLELTEL